MRTLSRHDRVVTLSRDAVAHYAHWIRPSRLTYCYNGVEEPTVDVPLDADDCRRIRELKGDGVLVANICFFDKIKGLDVLIRALALLPAHYRLLLIGNGAEDGALQQLAQRQALSQSQAVTPYRGLR